MSNLEDRASGIALWATEIGDAQAVAAKLVEHDRAAYLWHVAQIVLTDEQVAKIESTAARLLACGYSPEGSDT